MNRDLSKFESPKVEPDGLTKELFGLKCPSKASKRRINNMSGGSYNYVYNKLWTECVGEMHDKEMDEMVKDFCDVLHDLEWWQSGDYSEDQYRETVSEFKKKWFNGDRSTRLKGYIDDQINAVRRQLYSLIGEEGEKNDR